MLQPRDECTIYNQAVCDEQAEEMAILAEIKRLRQRNLAIDKEVRQLLTQIEKIAEDIARLREEDKADSEVIKQVLKKNDLQKNICKLDLEREENSWLIHSMGR